MNIIKSSTPELVDLLVTRKCSRGCRWCYMDAKDDGKHADIKYIQNIVNVLTKNECLEIAVAGGDVLSHPNFLSILTYISENNIIPNFTTHRTDWLYNKKIKNIVENTCGGVAFTRSNKYYIENLVSTVKQVNFPIEKVVVHLVMGTIKQNDYIEVLELCFKENIQVTLLGYKDIGRGEFYKTSVWYDGTLRFIEYKDWWLQEILKLQEQNKIYKIGIDTKMVHDFKEELKQNNISEILWTAEEGKFSCFIDAVDKYISPSSYDLNNMEEITNVKNIIKQYEKF